MWKNTGGYYEGMSLRDYFAAKAMQGMLSDPQVSVTGQEAALASVSYKMADAMMKEREQK